MHIHPSFKADTIFKISNAIMYGPIRHFLIICPFLFESSFFVESSSEHVSTNKLLRCKSCISKAAFMDVRPQKLRFLLYYILISCSDSRA